jgi:CubicO group peptidase (beta-lactamase class C family)
MTRSLTGSRASSAGHAPLRIDQPGLRAWVDDVLHRHPAVGLTVGIVRHGALELFDGRGSADIASTMPITEDTVFRIGSVTKPFTAIAVMQLHEEGLIDLDAPANHYLRAFQLVPKPAGFRSATVRHLLTHTAGVSEARRVWDLLHREAGPVRGTSSDPEGRGWKAVAVARRVLPRRSPDGGPAQHGLRVLEPHGGPHGRHARGAGGARHGTWRKALMSE